MIEEWKYINGLDKTYEISNFGKIRRSLPCEGSGQHLTYVGKIIKGETTHRGYLRFRLKRKGKVVYSKTIHRIVAESFLPNPYSLPSVHHINHIKTDNRLSNLMWTSNEDNTQSNLILTADSLINMLDNTQVYTKQNLLDILRKYRVSS